MPVELCLVGFWQLPSNQDLCGSLYFDDPCVGALMCGFLTSRKATS